MNGNSPQPVSELLARWKDGEQDALKALIPMVYGELRRLAHQQLHAEGPHHSLQSAALVHEAYMRLVGRRPLELQNRAHFFAVAAQLMRQILVDFARKRNAGKRGANCLTISLHEAIATPTTRKLHLVALDEALHGLAAFDPRQSQIVELRFFGGLSINETSEALGISPATVKREWTSARAWLYRELDRAETA
jgi:RNA polymerase sigma factor (TIGR02999 family)